jgi:hypothetical protein
LRRERQFVDLPVVHAIGADQDPAFVEIEDLRLEKASGFVAAKGNQQKEPDEIAHRLVLDRRPDCAQLLERGDVIARLAGLRALVAIEIVASVMLDQALVLSAMARTVAARSRMFT